VIYVVRYVETDVLVSVSVEVVESVRVDRLNDVETLKLSETLTETLVDTVVLVTVLVSVE
jgi:hypothetical protein